LELERSQPEKKPFLHKKHFPQEMVKGTTTRSPHLKLIVLGTDLDNFAHGLVAEDVALFHRGHDAVEQMQVRAADGAGRDFDDGISPLLDLGVGNGVTSNVVLAVPS
jgi:hypothetical protein